MLGCHEEFFDEETTWTGVKSTRSRLAMPPPGRAALTAAVSNTRELPGGLSRDAGTSGPVSGDMTPGSTWNFQACHRDSLAGTSNLTDAVSVMLL
jgi:hypothetical protein